MSGRALLPRRSWTVPLIGAAALVLVVQRAAKADEGGPRARVDRLSLDNGVRVVLVRTERAGPVAVAVAVRDTSPIAGAEDVAALTLSEAAPRGELTVEERGTLLTTRSVRARASLTGLATLRTLVGPGDELPLLLYLTGQTMRDARWDDATLARANAHKAPTDGPRAFSVARERLFPRTSLAVGEPGAAPLEKLRALDHTRTRLETVVTVVGDFDADRAAELVHQHLDGLPRRTSPAAPSPPTSAALPAAPPLITPTFAVTLAVRIDGAPARRRTLSAAFDVLSRGRLRGLRDSSSTLMVNDLDEVTAGARLVGLRVVVTDAAALRSAASAITDALGKLVASGPTPAELAIANARLGITDELRALSPLAHASDTALAELAGERSSVALGGGAGGAGGAGGRGSATKSPAEAEANAASWQALLADGFGEPRRVILREEPSP